jgi:hypothetical protein
VGLRAGLDNVEKRKFLTLLRLEFRPLGRSASSQLLYRLRYPGSFVALYLFKSQRLGEWVLSPSSGKFYSGPVDTASPYFSY